MRVHQSLEFSFLFIEIKGFRLRYIRTLNIYLVLYNIIKTHIQTLVYGYPVKTTTQGVLVPRKDILRLPKYAVGDKVYATTKGEILHCCVRTVLTWRLVTTEENETRYVLADMDHNIIHDNTDTTQPYKFHESNLQALHPEGTFLHIRFEEKDLIGVVKDSLVETNTQSCLVTVVTDNPVSGSSVRGTIFQANTEDRVIPRSTWMRKVRSNFKFRHLCPNFFI